MNIYFAHSFSCKGALSSLRSDADSSVSEFVQQLEVMGVNVIDPADTNLSSPEARYERCLSQIRSCDLLLIDATDKLGLGVGAEMMFAKSQGIPVFSVVPPRSHYRLGLGDRSVYHAFVCGLTSHMFLSFEECAQAITAVLNGRNLDG